MADDLLQAVEIISSLLPVDGEENVAELLVPPLVRLKVNLCLLVLTVEVVAGAESGVALRGGGTSSSGRPSNGGLSSAFVRSFSSGETDDG